MTPYGPKKKKAFDWVAKDTKLEPCLKSKKTARQDARQEDADALNEALSVDDPLEFVTLDDDIDWDVDYMDFDGLPKSGIDRVLDDLE